MAAKRRGRATPWVLAGLAVAVLAALIVPRMVAPGSGAASRTYPQVIVPSGITVTTTLSATPTDPFAGTPAATFPQGAAGITLPQAPPPIEADLRQVRKALIAGRLDDMMLTGHDPARLIALLAPGQRPIATAWFKNAAFTGLATWIDPAVKLDPHEEPRVSGRVTYATVRVGGIPTLRVTTNFIWVYAFAGLDHPLAAVHDEVVWEFPASGMWVGATRFYPAWMDCGAAERGLLAPIRAVGPERSTGPSELLRPEHTLDLPNQC